MTVGGFDTMYKSPFWCDVDFWLKLELLNQLKFVMCHSVHLYHFGSIATKRREDAEAESFKQSEEPAAKTFKYKWGYIPDLVQSAKSWNNTKMVNGHLNGIDFGTIVN